MSEERYIAAIEISSSKIIGAVGRAHPNGQVDIIAVDQERSVESVRYGVIQNLEEVATRLARVLDHLERKPSVGQRKIKSIFVGLSGRSLRSIPTTVRLNLPDDSEITDDILKRLREDALSTAIDNTLEIVDVVPRLYRVGKLETTNPRGVIGNEIVADYDIIVCRPELKRNLSRVIKDKLGIQTAGFVVTALSTAHLILTDQEKALGCMLVDMGAETTTVSIYRHKALYYLATLPFGGRHITRDLTSLPLLLEDRAEEIKTTSGCAIAPDPPSTLNLSGVKVADVINYTVARSEEIVANITEQIAYAGLKEKDLQGGGVICIGGGSKLNGMTELISRQLGVPVKIGRLPSYVVIDDLKGPTTEIVQVGSILYAGATLTDEQCLEMPVREELPPTGDPNDTEEEENERKRPRKEPKQTGRNFFARIKGLAAGMFSNPEDEDDSFFN
ncbi:MAG: cell division protein FtsA [Bacteroides sp.]|nr:cell division protein FtsA [Bacteroides sp.]